MTAESIIEKLGMKPLPEEGGYYLETHRANHLIPADALPPKYGSPRCFGTSILYLITDKTPSKMHRVKSDEIFYFHLGSPVTMLQLDRDGSSKTITIGNDIFAGHSPQVIVPNGTWQGCFLEQPDSFALLSCHVNPGFEFADYTHGQQDQLINDYPHAKDLIQKLT